MKLYAKKGIKIHSPKTNEVASLLSYHIETGTNFKVQPWNVPISVILAVTPSPSGRAALSITGYGGKVSWVGEESDYLCS